MTGSRLGAFGVVKWMVGWSALLNKHSRSPHTNVLNLMLLQLDHCLKLNDLQHPHKTSVDSSSLSDPHMNPYKKNSVLRKQTT